MPLLWTLFCHVVVICLKISSLAHTRYKNVISSTDLQKNKMLTGKIVQNYFSSVFTRVWFQRFVNISIICIYSKQ